MTYVRLTALPNTWFKEGTEVFTYDSEPPHDLCRLTLDEWKQSQFVVLCRGIRVPTGQHEIELFGAEERWDGEACSPSEFAVEETEEPR